MILNDRVGGFDDIGDDALDRLPDLQQQFPSVFSDGCLPHTYLHDEVALHLHIRARLLGSEPHDLCAVFVWRGRYEAFVRAGELGDKVDGSHLRERCDCVEYAVFVPIVEPMEGIQRVLGRVSSVVRLTPIDLCAHPSVESFQASTHNRSRPGVSGCANGICERIFDLSKFFCGEGISGGSEDKVIERGPEILGAISDQESEAGAVRLPVDLESRGVHPAFVAQLRPETVGIALNPGHDLALQRVQMFVSPLDFGVDAGKVEWHC